MGHFPLLRGGPDGRPYNKQCGVPAVNMGSRKRFRFICDSPQPLTGRYIILNKVEWGGLDVAEVEMYLNGEQARVNIAI